MNRKEKNRRIKGDVGKESRDVKRSWTEIKWVRIARGGKKWNKRREIRKKVKLVKDRYK